MAAVIYGLCYSQDSRWLVNIFIARNFHEQLEFIIWQSFGHLAFDDSLGVVEWLLPCNHGHDQRCLDGNVGVYSKWLYPEPAKSIVICWIHVYLTFCDTCGGFNLWKQSSKWLGECHPNICSNKIEYWYNLYRNWINIIGFWFKLLCLQQYT